MLTALTEFVFASVSLSDATLIGLFLFYDVTQGGQGRTTTGKSDKEQFGCSNACKIFTKVFIYIFLVK